MKEWLIYKIFDGLEVVAGSTTKDKEKEYSFSLALHTKEDRDKILQNRAKFMGHFDSRFKFVSQFQVHSNKIVNIDKGNLEQKWVEFKLNADGFVTTKPFVMLNILTADCIALLAYDKRAKVLGAAHAGWQGSRGNIAKNLINSMVNIGAKKRDIIIAISPSIRGCCYEVGKEVAKYFKNYPNSLIKTSTDKWHLDISIVNKEQLLDLGILEENIQIAKSCTACSFDRYFSYRKECGCSGRFINFIGMIE